MNSIVTIAIVKRRGRWYRIDWDRERHFRISAARAAQILGKNLGYRLPFQPFKELSTLASVRRSTQQRGGVMTDVIGAPVRESSASGPDVTSLQGTL